MVVAADGANRFSALGHVTGPYRYEAGANFAHQRPVEWLDLGEWRALRARRAQSAVRELKRHPVNLVELERRLITGPVLPPPPSPNS